MLKYAKRSFKMADKTRISESTQGLAVFSDVGVMVIAVLNAMRAMRK